MINKYTYLNLNLSTFWLREFYQPCNSLLIHLSSLARYHHRSSCLIGSEWLNLIWDCFWNLDRFRVAHSIQCSNKFPFRQRKTVSGCPLLTRHLCFAFVTWIRCHAWLPLTACLPRCPNFKKQNLQASSLKYSEGMKGEI